MPFFDDMAGVAFNLLAPDLAGGLGVSGVSLIRRTTTTPAEEWREPDTVETREVLRAFAQSGIEFSDQTAILASDVVITAAMPQMDWRIESPGTLFVDLAGRVLPVVMVEAVPPVPTHAYLMIVARSGGGN